MVGYAYGRAVTGAENGHLVVAKGLGLAAVLHGLYDFALMSGWVSPVLLLVVIGALVRVPDRADTACPYAEQVQALKQAD